MRYIALYDTAAKGCAVQVEPFDGTQLPDRASLAPQVQALHPDATWHDRPGRQLYGGTTWGTVYAEVVQRPDGSGSTDQRFHTWYYRA